MENLDNLLGKTLASNSDSQNIIAFTTAWHEAESARTSLSSLPLDVVNMMRSHQYIAQLGDFCYSLAQKAANGQEVSQEEWETVRQLHQETRTIHSELRDLMALAQEKKMRFGSLARSRNMSLTPEAQDILAGFGRISWACAQINFFFEENQQGNSDKTAKYEATWSDQLVGIDCQ